MSLGADADLFDDGYDVEWIVNSVPERKVRIKILLEAVFELEDVTMSMQKQIRVKTDSVA